MNKSILVIFISLLFLSFATAHAEQDHIDQDESRFNLNILGIILVVIIIALIFFFILKYQKNKTESILRIAIFTIFFTHGITALTTKTFTGYLTLIGFSEPFALSVIPLIGLLDIFIGLIILIKPFKIVLIWASTWPLIPAIIELISSNSILDFVGSIPTWSIPLALLYLKGIPKNLKQIFD